MWIKTISVLFIALILSCDFVFAQDVPAITDSTNLYKNIESYSKRSKITGFLYRLVFKPVATSSPKKKAYKKLIQKPYSAFEGKTIRRIDIKTLDPFGYSVTDTNAAAKNFLYKAGNKLHVKSQQITIRNLLLIRQNQLFDSLLVKESERLVRSRGYVHDVSFFVIATSKNSDSVDIFIRELDNWSILPDITASNSRISINLTDGNILGLGHESQNGFTWYHRTGAFGYNINYFIPNIRNTFITSTLHYKTDEFENFNRGFAIDRPFFSPLAKWAAGINITQQLRRIYIPSGDSLYVQQRFKFTTQDYWAGHAVQIFKGNTEYIRTTNFISAVRYLRVRYLEKPVEPFDMQYMFSNEDLYLASIGISARKYVQDKYIFNFGLTEDVPIGKVYSLTGGYQKKNNTGRFYLGARVSSGTYYPWGYLGSNFEYGAFLHASHIEQSVITASVHYFTGLIEIGKWKFRQFVKPQVTFGINRFSYDTLTLNDDYGLNGFNSKALVGTSRLLFTFQTQSYAPWHFIGFRFGPFLSCSFGMLGNAATGFKNSTVYSQIGLGVLIKNENLIINTFQISFSFYPIIPGKGQNIFRFDNFKTGDFGFMDFEIEKPAIIEFH